MWIQGEYLRTSRPDHYKVVCLYGRGDMIEDRSNKKICREEMYGARKRGQLKKRWSEGVKKLVEQMELSFR